jgi:hypothetical protein
VGCYCYISATLIGELPMKITIETGKTEDINELEKLYNDLNDYLAEHINYPGWKKGIYHV